MTDNIHKGHRERTKQEFLANGFNESTPMHKILELLLFFCINRNDTNPLAHELINKYKTLSGVLDAPVDELIQFNGLTKSNVVLLKLIIPIARIYISETQQKQADFNNIDDVGNFFLNKYLGLKVEKLGILGLDASGHKLFFEFISEGDLASVGVSTRNIIKLAIESDATCVIVVHNHPNGTALPSRADVQITATIASALSQINVRLLDHMIISNGDFISMRQSEQYKSVFQV